MFPLYEPFLPLNRSKVIANNMIATDKGGGIHTSIGAMASSVPALQTLRFCPTCVSEETKLYGEPYWHRTHQVPGVFVCHAHGDFLKNSNVIVESQVNKHRFISAYHGTRRSIDIDAPFGSSIEHLLPIALMVFALLNNTYEILGLRGLQKRYVKVLREQGLASVGGRVPQRDLVSQFSEFYSEDLLIKSGCGISLVSQENWLNDLVRKSLKSRHPIRHILLIHFLGMTLDDFFSCNPVYSPFGRAPWPCLNNAAEHYREQVVTNCTIGQNCETKAPTGTFSCDCGFVYSRSGPDRCRDDKYEFSRVISRGHVWEKKLLQLIETEGKSLRAAARHLHVDTNTVIKHLRRLQSCVVVSKPENDSKTTADLLKEEWLQLIADYPDLSRKQLRLSKPALYSKLYRSDRAWLLKNPELDRPERKPYDRIDWVVRDHQLAEATRKALNSLNQQQELSHSITISKIGKMVGELALFQRHLEKLPETKSVLMAIPNILAKEKHEIRD